MNSKEPIEEKETGIDFNSNDAARYVQRLQWQADDVKERWLKHQGWTKRSYVDGRNEFGLTEQLWSKKFDDELYVASRELAFCIERIKVERESTTGMRKALDIDDDA